MTDRREFLLAAATTVLHQHFYTTSALPLLRLAEGELHDRFRPKPKLTLSEWSDEHRVLSRESSAEPGQWRTARVPYLKGIMDAISDPMVERVIEIKPAQVGFTEITLNAVGYFMDQDPSPILVIQPNVDPMAKYWAKSRLSPMLRDSPRLRGLVSTPKRADSGNTILHKSYPGGEIFVVGANSAASLASRPIRVVIADEVDKFDLSHGPEADPVALAESRQDTFANRLLIIGSTPENKSDSRIEAEYEADEVEQRQYFVPCPHCGHMQTLKWSQVQWDDGHPETAAYQCGDISDDGELEAGCGRLIDERYKMKMLRAGDWLTTRPPRIKMQRRRIGFKINGLYSAFRAWQELARMWLKAQGNPTLLKQFINERLGESWEEAAEKIDEDSIKSRRADYGAQVPKGVGMLTAGIDVQADRLELLVVGWGIDFESWRIGFHTVWGDPAQLEPWQRLETLLVESYKHELGADMRIACACIDSGYQTDAVYRFVKPRQTRKVYATKGIGGRPRPLVGRRVRTHRGGVRVFPIGTDPAKDNLFARLKYTMPGPGYMHFNRTIPDAFVDQFGAEVAKTKFVRGIPTKVYVQIEDRNEAIDLEVLNMAALDILGAAVYDHLDYWVRQVALDGDKATRKAQSATTTTPAARSDKVPWVHRWKHG